MERLSKREWKELLTWSDPPAVSLYLPNVAADDPKKKRIRLKNLLRRAERQLCDTALRRGEVRELLGPAMQWLRQADPRVGGAEGLAVFIGRGLFRHYTVPVEVPEQAEVGDGFDLAPLLPLMTAHSVFYVVAVSQRSNRLLRCTPFGGSRVELDGAPPSLADTLRFDEFQQQVRLHATGAGVNRQPVAAAHGQRAAGDKADHKEHVFRYLQGVGRAVCSALGEQRSPLVFAGVEYLFGLFRAACKHPGLLAEHVPGNPDRASAEALRRRAWALVAPEFRRDLEAAVDDYHRAASQGQATSDVREVVRAAWAGRVATLFADLGRPRWGTFDPSQGSVGLHDRQQTGDVNLVNLAAVHVFLHGGTIFRPGEEAPVSDSPVAAVLRR